MLNTEQIKMPQSKLQKTDSYQPVVAFFFSSSSFLLLPAVLCSFLIVCLTRSACTKKVNRHGAYNSVVIVAAFAVLARGTRGGCVSRAGEQIPAEQGTSVGMND